MCAAVASRLVRRKVKEKMMKPNVEKSKLSVVVVVTVVVELY